MEVSSIIYPMIIHIAWVVFLYVLLTIFRAPKVWGIGIRKDSSNSWGEIEPRVSANLSNQFEWPLFFYLACILSIVLDARFFNIVVLLAWCFVIGRFIHSAVQILTTNIRLRGVVFTINFLAVLGMWFCIVYGEMIKN